MATDASPLPTPGNDVELFACIEQTLYTAVIADSLDELGFHDCAMTERIRPVGSVYTFAGWAKTIACTDMYHAIPNPYEKEIEAIDSILPGEVAVVSTHESRRNAPWGELVSNACVGRGARGAVVDGLCRDVKKIDQIGFPVFAAGIKCVDSRGRGMVYDYDVPVNCGGVLVHPGDLIAADYDGVVVVPKRAVYEVIRLAAGKVAREDRTREELQEGAYLRDVFARHGVL